jgi:hypothetical protein
MGMRPQRDLVVPEGIACGITRRRNDGPGAVACCGLPGCCAEILVVEAVGFEPPTPGLVMGPRWLLPREHDDIVCVSEDWSKSDKGTCVPIVQVASTPHRPLGDKGPAE